MVEGKFWVKRSNATFPLGRPFVVMAMGKSGQKTLWGEYSILISGSSPMFINKYMTIDADEFPQEIVEDYSTFIKEEVVQRVEEEISNYYFQQYEKTDNNFYLQKHDLEDAPKEDILRLWLRGKFENEIRKLKNKTRSDELKEYLETVVFLKPFTGTDTV